ncbi:MAG: Helix-turn-helix domain [Verrucomicrobiota bacterium]|jgi:cytoskeletal protein RodZ
MEGLGKKLKEARLARNLTLEEAGRLTKIRPGRLEEIENEDFSQFASLAYAKGFLLIYGKFLEVDVSPYTEAFETSDQVTTDGYAYLQDNPAPPPTRTVVVRRQSSSGSRGSLLPFVIGVVILVVGYTAMKWILDIQRLKPRPTPTPGTSPMASATASDKIVAPHALPTDGTTPPPATTTPEAIVSPTPTVSPAVTPFVPTTAASPSEPEVRRAEPVHPEDSAKVPTPTPRPTTSPRKSPRRSPSPIASPSPTTRPR